jgi:uncharacterized protein YaiL (DUF2058 family)
MRDAFTNASNRKQLAQAGAAVESNSAEEERLVDQHKVDLRPAHRQRLRALRLAPAGTWLGGLLPLS